MVSHGAAATAAAALPAFSIQATDQAGTRFPVVGTGKPTYSWVHDRLLPPDRMVWSDTPPLGQDAAGHVYVGQTGGKSGRRGEARDDAEEGQTEAP